MIVVLCYPVVFWHDDIMLRLFVGYCYDLDYMLIDVIGVSIIIVIFWG